MFFFARNFYIKRDGANLLIQLKRHKQDFLRLSFQKGMLEKSLFHNFKKPAMWNLRNVFATDILLPTTHDYRWIMSRWRKVLYIKIS